MTHTTATLFLWDHRFVCVCVIVPKRMCWTILWEVEQWQSWRLLLPPPYQKYLCILCSRTCVCECVCVYRIECASSTGYVCVVILVRCSVNTQLSFNLAMEYKLPIYKIRCAQHYSTVHWTHTGTRTLASTRLAQPITWLKAQCWCSPPLYLPTSLTRHITLSR